ncbi:MAG: SsrA-binding protein SmpB [Bacteroidetes bacterium]|nr:SsrA-binding protein SmpB [Bacteroidota bacterium]MBK9425322.1 SsrA-binding protein SmpB [Bacteroidota bacterium]MBL0072156.1 SsrA-binding protein SmpB [Bacteroidota bacterium]
MAETTIVNNKKAVFEYHIETKYEAGLVLTGTEIKSVRASQVNLADSFCVFMNGELWVKGMHISEYKEASYNNHAAKRDRKLLLRQTELRKLGTKMKEKGYTLIPVRLYINEKGLAKLEIALARGKKLFDKREDLKKKDDTLEMSRIKKAHNKYDS